jgi:hypothetical protein
MSSPTNVNSASSMMSIATRRGLFGVIVAYLAVKHRRCRELAKDFVDLGEHAGEVGRSFL